MDIDPPCAFPVQYDEEGNYLGCQPRECGEHRTVGYRAWCHDCGEWCKPLSPCARCELPVLRQRATVAAYFFDRAERMAHAGTAVEAIEGRSRHSRPASSRCGPEGLLTVAREAHAQAGRCLKCAGADVPHCTCLDRP